MSKQLLREHVLFEVSPDMVMESLQRNDGKLIVKGVLQRANAKSGKEVSKETTVSKKQGEPKKPAAAAVSGRLLKDIAHVLKQPRITEKATESAERGAYVFEVSPRATKKDVAQAVRDARHGLRRDGPLPRGRP